MSCSECKALQNKIARLEALLGTSEERENKAVRVAFDISQNEAHALLILTRAKGEVVNSYALVEGRPTRLVSKNDPTSQEKLAKVMIVNLRNRLGRDWIETLWGKGYRATADCINAVESARRSIL
jgi:DNA-binding response OmpR family regulator